MILKILEKKRSITVTELSKLLNISELTARRDITVLNKSDMQLHLSKRMSLYF